MKTKTMTAARKDFFNLAQSIIETHEPMVLTGKHGNIVMLSEEDFQAIQETVQLQLIPNLVNDIKKGRKAPDSDFCTRAGLFDDKKKK